MRCKVMTYQKRRQAIEDFAKEVEAFVETAPFIRSVHLMECGNSNNDIVVTFTLGRKALVPQGACVLAWLDTDNAEAVVNATVEAAERAGKEVMHINLLSLSTSPRILAVLIVEQSAEQSAGGAELHNGQVDDQAKAETQDADTNAKPKRRAKRKVSAPN